MAGGRSVAISRTELDDATFKGDIEQMRMLLLGICDVDQAASAGNATADGLRALLFHVHVYVYQE